MSQAFSSVRGLMLRISSRNAVRAARQASQLGDWPNASREYARALKSVDDRPALWVQYGHALKEQGDLEGAEAAYRRARELSQGVADVYLQLGHVSKLKGDRAAALKHYRLASEIDSGLDEVSSELERLEHDEYTAPDGTLYRGDYSASSQRSAKIRA